ncbi:MAG: hypothetical protein HPY69_01020 [Armatimonadetes bacterium]|nr:hypothetical protein [Armatimonadota bacterium]
MKAPLLAAVLLVLPVSVLAEVWEYAAPIPMDICDLDKYSVYQWQIRVDGHESLLQVLDATITFRNIWDWQPDNDDCLFVTLLDDLYTYGGGWQPLGSTTWRHRDYNRSADYFAGKYETYPSDADIRKPWGVSVGTWSDPNGGADGQYAADVTFSLKDLGLLDELLRYASNDGKFVFGIDPDCYYHSQGISFAMQADKEGLPVRTPELSTWLLLASSLVATLALRLWCSKGLCRKRFSGNI